MGLITFPYQKKAQQYGTLIYYMKYSFANHGARIQRPVVVV